MRISVFFLIGALLSQQLWAVGVCDVKQIETSEVRYLESIDKMLRDPNGDSKEIYALLQDYKNITGTYPALIDNQSGLHLNRRLAGRAPDGKWLIVEVDGSVSWSYNPLSEYSLVKQPQTSQFQFKQTVWSKEVGSRGLQVTVTQDLGDGRFVVTNGKGLRVIKAEDLSSTPVASPKQLKSLILEQSKSFDLPEAKVKKMFSKASNEDLELVQKTMDKVAKHKINDLDEAIAAAKLMDKYGLQDIMRFHNTAQGTIPKILNSQVDGQPAAVMVPGKKDFTIYTLAVPASRNGLKGKWQSGRLNFNETSDTIIFTNQAAELFNTKTIPTMTGVMLHKARQVQRSGYGRMVIDEYYQKDGFLVVTKAHMIPIEPGRRVGAAIGYVSQYTLLDIAVGTGVGAAVSIFSEDKNKKEKPKEK